MWNSEQIKSSLLSGVMDLLSTAKIKNMIVDFWRNTRPVKETKIMGPKVDQVENYKYLGTVTDSSLTLKTNWGRKKGTDDCSAAETVPPLHGPNYAHFVLLSRFYLFLWWHGLLLNTKTDYLKLSSGPADWAQTLYNRDCFRPQRTFEIRNLILFMRSSTSCLWTEVFKCRAAGHNISLVGVQI